MVTFYVVSNLYDFTLWNPRNAFMNMKVSHILHLNLYFKKYKLYGFDNMIVIFICR